MFPTKHTISTVSRLALVLSVLAQLLPAQHLSSARGTSLGAFTALTNDITSLDWNPAGLVNIRDWEVLASSYAAFRSDAPTKGIGLYSSGTAKRFLENHVIAGSYSPGLSVEFLSTDGLQVENDGSSIDFQTRITYREQYALAYGYQIGQAVGLGISARYREQLISDTQILNNVGSGSRIVTNDYVANSWNLDVGMNWRYSPQWTFGAVAKNLFKLTESEIPQELLPFSLRTIKSLRLGAAYHHSSILTAALDFDTQKNGGAGIEWDLEAIQLRNGLFFGTHMRPFVTGLSAGIGWSYGPAKFDLSYIHFLNQKARRDVSVKEFIAQGIQDIGYNRFSPNQLMLTMNISLGRMREAWAKIEHIQILSEVFPSSYQVHAVRPLGRARIKNVSPQPIEARVSFFVEQYMDAPTETRPYYIPPNEEVEIPFTAIFNDAIRFVPTMVLRAAEVFVKASPTEGYDDKSQTKLVIRGRNDWDGDALTLRNFVTPDDPELLRFSRNMLNRNRDTLNGVSKPLEKFRIAALLFDEFSSRLTYVSDPKNSKDRVQYPGDTYALRGGDCDDITVAYASLLASVGMSTAFVDVIPPERPQEAHIFVLFDTGLPATQADVVSKNPKRYVIRKNEQGVETVWVPVETTMLRDGFQKAWEVGADEYLKYVEVGLGVIRGWVRVVDILPR